MEIKRFRRVPRRHCLTLAVAGEVDHEHWEIFREAILESARPRGTRAVVLDLSRVVFFDSGGIRAVVNARRVLESRGVAMHLDGASPPVQRLFEMSGLVAYIPPYPN
jgi:stage II sporulation protein AA (anti-sigma F factor antagonist)